MTKTIPNAALPGIIAGCLVLVVLLWLAFRSQKTLEAGLPPRVECKSQAEALQLAGKGSIPILGTGSMAPFIPSAKPGQVPLDTVVAYATTSAKGYDDITPGALCIYRPTWPNPTGAVMHSAALHDRSGWIMSGLNNARSESWARVTPANFIGIVDRVYVW